MINKLEKKEVTLMQDLILTDYLPCSPDNLGDSLVLPGDLITSEEGYMPGSGTIMLNNKLYSTLLGTIQKTNKLLIV